MLQLDDLWKSDYAAIHKIDNTPDDKIKERLDLFLYHAIRPLEELFSGKVLNYHSCYRSPELNKALKGVPDSQHMEGNALDFTIDGELTKDTWLIIKNSSLRYDQLIIEHNITSGAKWVHFSYNTDLPQNKQRMEAIALKVK